MARPGRSRSRRPDSRCCEATRTSTRPRYGTSTRARPSTGRPCIPGESSECASMVLSLVRSLLYHRDGSRLTVWGHDRPSRDQIHTDIEEELHEKANIDYDRVAIVSGFFLEKMDDPPLSLLAVCPCPGLKPMGATYRSRTRRWRPCTRMPSSSRPARPSRRPAPSRPTPGPRPVDRRRTNASSRRMARRRRSGGVR